MSLAQLVGYYISYARTVVRTPDIESSLTCEIVYFLYTIVRLEYLKSKINNFFFGGRGSNPGPYMYYALSLPTELSSRKLKINNLMLVNGG